MHVVTRQRFLKLADGQRETYAVEHLFYQAHPDEHAEQLQRARIPANEQFYASDKDAEGTGWIETPHVTMIRLEPVGDSREFAWARYHAFRFHRGNARKTSVIRGKEDFEEFVGQHPALRYVIEESLDSGYEIDVNAKRP